MAAQPAPILCYVRSYIALFSLLLLAVSFFPLFLVAKHIFDGDNVATQNLSGNNNKSRQNPGSE